MCFGCVYDKLRVWLLRLSMQGLRMIVQTFVIRFALGILIRVTHRDEANSNHGNLFAGQVLAGVLLALQ